MGDKIKLLPPEGTTSASVDGVQYDVGDDGLFEVDAGHALQLYGFGFCAAPAGYAQQAAPGKADKRKASDASAPTA